MTLLQEKSNSVSSRAKSRDLSQSILQTLKYSDHFGFPLTLAELRSRLIRTPWSTPTKHLLDRLIKEGQVIKTGRYYHLPTSRSLVSRRLLHNRLSRPLLARAHQFAHLLSRFPGVIAIYLTGSLALHNSTGHDDIDFMIITRPNHLWTTRFFLTLYTSFFGLRRTPHSPNHLGKLCLNLYLTPTSYQLPKHKQSLYTAYELIQAVPLHDPSNTHANLLAANPWIKNYLPNYPAGPGPAGPSNPPTGPGPIGTLFEFLFYHLQLWYMRPRLTREYITPDSAFFHPHNPAPKV